MFLNDLSADESGASTGKWPGLRMAWPQVRNSVARPLGFFCEDGPMPDEATLVLSRPPAFADRSDEELAVMLKHAVDEREATIRREVAHANGCFLGRRAVRKQSPFDRPGRGEPRRELSPRVAAKNKWRRIEALQRLQTFLDDYRLAFEMWRAGLREVVFPAGTYKLRVQADIRCADA